MRDQQTILFIALIAAAVALIGVTVYQQTHTAPVEKIYTYNYVYSL